MKITQYNLLFVFFSLLPLTIVVGPSVSLITILSLIIIFLIKLPILDIKKIYTNKICISLFVLYLYLIFNTVISIDPYSGILRNLGFLRFLLFFVVVNYFFYLKSDGQNIFIFWSVIIFIFITDIFIERFSGTNILGFGAQPDHGLNQDDSMTRVVSFFKDEAIAGAFVNGFIFIIIGYLFTVLKKKNYSMFICIILFIISLVAVLMTGERSNTIKIFIGFIIFFLFLDFPKFKIKLLFLLFVSGLLFLIILSSDYLKLRYKGQFYSFLSTKEIRDKTIENNVYINLYRSGYEVFTNYPLLGVGTKNYRIETCKKNKEKNLNYFCTTHPHQIYIELLAEHGILGSILILYILFFSTFKILRQIIMSRNYIQIGSFIYLLINFIPLLPSGSFFSQFNITLFMINFCIMYAVNEKTNIFYFKN